MNQKILLKRTTKNGITIPSSADTGELFMNCSNGNEAHLLFKTNAVPDGELTENNFAIIPEKKWNDTLYASKAVEEDVLDLNAKVTTLDDSISGINQTIIDNEYVVANVITQINASAGFDESGNSTLNNGEKIKTGKLRGLPSYGMFCSGEELGITDDWYEGASTHGILIFKEDYPLGVEVKEILELEDVMFDINITANRADCQSILGIAREVAAQLGAPLDCRTLVRRRRTRTQTKLNVKDKTANVSGAFRVHLKKESDSTGQSRLPKVKHILLIDDLFTTGSTLYACFTALREVFPSSVRISVATLGFVGGA